MRFGNLSSKPGAVLELPQGAVTKIDVVGVDDEIALAIECKSSEQPARRPGFQEELGKHRLIREAFSIAIRNQFLDDIRRQTVLALFTWNISLSDNDRARAKDANVVLLDEHDLQYYEKLVVHLGSAAKYQFFADLMPGKDVPGGACFSIFSDSGKKALGRTEGQLGWEN